MSTLRTEDRLLRRGFLLEYLTVGWNVVEAGVAVTAGILAGSIALVGFGADSVVEVFSAVVVIWRLRGSHEEREERALKLIALSFFALAAYVGVESVRDLIVGAAAETSIAGLAVTALSLVVMPALAVAKARTGRALASRVLIADSRETWLCAALSAIVLGGLALNALFGWWWADPVAALGVAWLAVSEGREAWEGDDD